MELREITGFDENRNPTTIKLPTRNVIKMALLNLDYSNGAISLMDAKNQLADQFCLSGKQKSARTERNASVNLWGDQVGLVIAGLVDQNRLIQPKSATIITPEALKVILSLFFKKLGYESIEIGVDENPDDMHLGASVDIKTRSLKFSVACDPTSAPADA